MKLYILESLASEEDNIQEVFGVFSSEQSMYDWLGEAEEANRKDPYWPSRWGVLETTLDTGCNFRILREIQVQAP